MTREQELILIRAAVSALDGNAWYLWEIADVIQESYDQSQDAKLETIREAFQAACKSGY